MWSRRSEDYLIVGCVFWVNFCLFGLLRSGALIYVELVKTFNCSHDVASWPLSLAGASICMIGPVAGLLEKTISIRAIVTSGVFISSASCVLCYFAEDVTTFVLLIGLLYGIGTGLTCTLTPVLINERFPPDQRAMACGIAFSGSTMGSFFWPYLLEWLAAEFNLRGAMLIYGGLILNALAGSVFLKRPKKPLTQTLPANDAEKPEVGEVKVSLVTAADSGVKTTVASEHPTSYWKKILLAMKRDFAVVLDPYFQLVTVSSVCFFFVYVTVFIVIPDYAMDSGIERTEAMFLITIFGISDLISKPLPGMLTYNNFLSTKSLLIIGSVSMGAICFILPHTRAYVWFATITFFYGFLTGGLVFLSPILITETMPMEQAPVAFGLSNFFVGLTGFLRPPFIGIFKGSFGNYDGLFYSMGVLCMASAALWCFEPLIQRSRKKDELENKQTNTAETSPEHDPLVCA